MKIVLSMPHVSLWMPERNGWEKCNKEELDKVKVSMADMEVDRLFEVNPDVAEDVKAFAFYYSRLYCDPERLIDDEMEKKGQGILYTEAGGLKREVTKELTDRVESERAEYIAMLSSALTKPNTLLIDCHSFTPTEENRHVDFCIGFNDDWSKPSNELLNLIKTTIEGWGYSVVFNEPYSNSITPIACRTYRSVMIEVNKEVYLREDMRTMKADAYKLNAKINQLYRLLKDYGTTR